MNLPMVRKYQTPSLDFNDPAVLNVMRATIAADATDPEFAMFLAFCKSTGLNPFKKEIWFIKTKAKNFWSKRDGKQVDVPAKVQMMAGINGFFSIANEHPQYDGMKEPEYEIDADGRLLSCRVEVYRKDRRFPSVGVARWEEFFPGVNENGKPGIWETKPHHMLAKVAKSIALREAFPQQLGGLYIEEEMEATKLATTRAELVEDDLPEKFAPSIAEQEMMSAKEISETMDPALIGTWTITTKGKTCDMSVEQAVDEYREQIENSLDKYKSADKLILSTYLKLTIPVPNLDPIETVMSREEIEAAIDNLPLK